MADRDFEVPFEVPVGKLRECLDPLCDEYKDSTMREKIEILREIQKNMPLDMAIFEYKKHYSYRNEPSNPLSVLSDGFVNIIEHLLRKDEN
jgi:hypothetical protein